MPQRLLTLVINLDRSPERWQRMAQRLQALGLPYERLPAVDARRLSPQQQAQLDVAAFEHKHGKAPLLGELGCYLSHVEAMKRLLASEADCALVLEDDVQLTDRLPAALAGLMAHARRWDMVKLSAVHSGTPRRLLEVAPGQHLAVMLSRCTGSSAYLVNRHAAQRYVERLLPMSLPYDHVFDRGWHFGLKVRLLTPTPCVHGDASESTIEAPAARQVTRRFHWTRRLGAYRYRAGNELRRLAWGLSQVWAERHGKG